MAAYVAVSRVAVNNNLNKVKTHDINSVFPRKRNLSPHWSTAYY